MQEIDITGIILPIDWDKNGKVTEIAIYTHTEEVYAVEHSSIVYELMNQMHGRVEVKGKIREHPDGNKSIAVQNYTAIDEIVDDDKKTN